MIVVYRCIITHAHAFTRSIANNPVRCHLDVFSDGVQDKTSQPTHCVTFRRDDDEDEDEDKDNMFFACVKSILQALKKPNEREAELGVSELADIHKMDKSLQGEGEGERPMGRANDTCDLAAADGNLKRLKELHENGCPWNYKTCTAAAGGGRLECLKYAHENGCPWTESTCTAAAHGGHLECLKYAHENGLRCDWKDALRRAHSKRVRAYIKEIIANGASTPLTQALLRIKNMIPTAAYEAMEKSAREMFGCVDRDTIRTKVTNIMAVLDDVKETIPTGEYLKIATELQYTFRSS